MNKLKLKITQVNWLHFKKILEPANIGFETKGKKGFLCRYDKIEIDKLARFLEETLVASEVKQKLDLTQSQFGKLIWQNKLNSVAIDGFGHRYYKCDIEELLSEGNDKQNKRR